MKVCNPFVAADGHAKYPESQQKRNETTRVISNSTIQQGILRFFHSKFSKGHFTVVNIYKRP